MTSNGVAEKAVAVEVRGLKKTFVTGFITYDRISRLFTKIWPQGARALSKRVEAVRGVDFTVRRGEVFGLLGPNGAGKTTTLKMLMGLIFPDAGNIQIFGAEPGSLKAKRQVGFLPENPYFYDYLKAEEFLSLVSALTGISRKEKKQRIQEIVEMVGLSNATDRPLRKFSKGMLQRIGLAQALLADPQLVVLDEPLSGLDPVGRKEIRDIVRGLKKKGKTVLFSSHILSDVELLCDRVAIMAQGRIRKHGPLEELLVGGDQGTEVVVEGRQELTEKLAQKTSLKGEAIGEKVRFFVSSRAAKDQLLREALAMGLSVEAVSPRRSSLEELFMVQAKESEGRQGHAEREAESDSDGEGKGKEDEEAQDP